ncbi:MAG TPA: (Fe-S)-binding protein [Desulfurivibrio alkaliphilus]|uniref:(Fe-S)-binding protein n=1 Tax=Desulfurivibrio alkaliphilus TaxID=427923 RepID=A0A7C2TIA7_9BACT|nr:(Fe-S)-binding protein [Desulfurivibrio alkaliphilus]
MADTKAAEMKLKVVREPSLMTGAVPTHNWWDVEAIFKPGNYCYPAKKSIAEYHGKNLPGLFGEPRDWEVESDDWKLPENWKEIIINGIKERLDKFRSLRIFMDCCVRCGACADKCHFFLGTGDPKNMPVLRAELFRSVYRNDFTLAGKILGEIAGARPMTFKVLKEWFMYFYQCTECRRCSVFCPYGIDTAEVTMMGRELLHLVGVNTNWILEPAANSNRTGNHLGLQPHTFKENAEFLLDDIEEATGVRLQNLNFNRKGAEVLFVIPSADVFADPGIFTFMGYILLFEHIGLDYTISTYSSEGGNFGLFTNNQLMKKLNGKMYAEAKRLGVKWILGGECGHMWRVVHQYMGTMNGPPDFLETPRSPITGTVFENAASTKMVHISEFTADLIKNNRLKIDKSRNDHRVVTYHDSCNTARGMGLMEEPRYILNSVCNNYYEMPENTIREKTFCCGSGTGLNTGEIMDLRMRAGLPRANAVKYVAERHGVNMLSCVCAIDRATLLTLNTYWNPEVAVCGVSELVGNALIMEGEKKRETDLRAEPLAGMEG